MIEADLSLYNHITAKDYHLKKKGTSANPFESANNSAILRDSTSLELS